MEHRKISAGQWCWISKRQLDMIKNILYKDKPVKIRTARSILIALAETSSDNNGKQSFKSYRAYIADKAVVSAATLDRYVKDFEKHGFIKKEVSREGKKMSACTWHLLDIISSPHYYDDSKGNSRPASHQDSDDRQGHNNDEVKNKHIIIKSEGYKSAKEMADKLRRIR